MNTNLNMQTIPIERLKPAKYNPGKDLKPGDPAYEKIKRSCTTLGISIPFEKVLRGNPHCTFAVNFRCYPFFYADASADIAVTTSGTVITNPGSVYSEPILTVTGSGDITLMVGTTIVELENISGSIIIDSVQQEAYQGTTLMNDHMNGEFPVLKPGINALSWSGTITKVVIQPNWRYL